MDETDTLEDWVAIKSQPFYRDKILQRYQFHVAWNSVEKKLAVTCRTHNRQVNDTESCGWSCLLTLHEVQSVHEQLCLVYPELTGYFPTLPMQPRTFWTVYVESDADELDEDDCQDLQQYFKTAVEVCGHKLVKDSLLEEHCYEDYFESVGELRRRRYDEEVKNAHDMLENILFLRDGAVNMLDMQDVYHQEDNAILKYNLALAQLYNYLLQPFLDMREIAFMKLQKARNGLRDPNLGARPKKEFGEMFAEWQHQYVQILDSVQKLYLEYYKKTKDLQKGVLDRMEKDKVYFGKNSFEVGAQERYYRVMEDYALENLQFLQSKKRFEKQEQDKLRQQIATLGENVTCQATLKHLENEIYLKQLTIYDESIKILAEEEKLTRCQIDRLLWLKAEETEAMENEFHDTVEDEQQLPEVMTTASEPHDERPSQYDDRLAKLKNKISVLCRKKAYVRNKKKNLMQADKDVKEKALENEERFKQHHTVQMKRDKQKEDLAKHEEYLKQERQKTLQRLKQYKMKYPTPTTLRSRRKPQKAESDLKTSITSVKQPHKDTCPSDCTDYDARLLGTTDTVIPPPPPLAPPPPPLVPPPPPPPVPPPPPAPPTPTLPASTPLNNSPSLQNQIHQQNAKSSLDVSSDGNVATLDLSNISAARSRLKKRDKPKAQQEHQDATQDMMEMIKLGVKLRPVSESVHAKPVITKQPQAGMSHDELLKSVLQRISARISESSDEESDDEGDEFA